MTNINISKGLFRFWVLFALCWVVPTMNAMFSSLVAVKTGYYDPVLADESIKQPEVTHVSPKGQWDIVSTIFKEDSLRNLKIQRAKKCRDAKTSLQIEYFCDAETVDLSASVAAPIWSKRREAAGIIFLPPMVLLLLGYGVLWAVSGFKE
jgi:hypothetical protein